MHCRMPGLCLALSCINSCINLSPANLSILRIETHFRFGCYRTPLVRRFMHQQPEPAQALQAGDIAGLVEMRAGHDEIQVTG